MASGFEGCPLDHTIRHGLPLLVEGGRSGIMPCQADGQIFAATDVVPVPGFTE